MFIGGNNGYIVTRSVVCDRILSVNGVLLGCTKYTDLLEIDFVYSDYYGLEKGIQ